MPDFESLKQRIELLERKQERILNDIHDERAEVSSESEQPIRLAYTTTSATYPPDPSKAFEIIFVDAYHAEYAGTPSFATVNHSLAAPRVGYSITGKHIPEDTLVAVFRQNSKYWILPYFPDAEPSPGGGSVQWLTTNFQSFPSITPDTRVSPAESKIIDFTNAVTTGSVTGVSFDGANKWTIPAGTYMVTWNASCDIDSGPATYSPGESYTDNLKVGAARIFLVNEAGSQIPEQAGYVTVHKPDPFHQTTTDTHRLVFDEADSIRLKIAHSDTSTSDNDPVRVFHAKVHILKFS